MSLTLGIDIGTFESKGVLVDSSGSILGQTSRPHKMLVPQAGWAEHDADKDWWGDFVHIAKALLAQSGIDASHIAAIGCSAIGPCMLPVDDEGSALMNGVLYGVDNRASEEVGELTEEIGEDILVRRCGNALTSQSVGPKILWLKRNRPEIFDRAERILTSTTYIVSKLTDRAVIDHYSAAGFSPLYDVEKQDWSDDLADDICDLGLLPDLLWSTDIAGTVTARAAAETGLAEGTPVLTGTIDAAAEAVSVGVTSPGEMMMMYGSTIFIIMPTAERISDSRLWYAPWLFEGQHASMAGLATSGTLTHWFRDQFAREMTAQEAFATLAEEAEASPPGANGLIVLPYFSGERTPIHDPHAKGTIFGLDLTHTRGDIYRAFIEGIALGTAHAVETFGEAGVAPQKLFAVGGGTKNSLWVQTTSDALQLPQTMRENSVGAAFGDAFLAAVAIGAADLSDIEKWNPISSVIEADTNQASRYKQQSQKAKTLYNQTKTLMQQTS